MKSASAEVAKCRRVPLPDLSLPKKFGVSWGCFTQGAFYGVDAVVAEGGVKGLYFRYVLPYDAIAKRYLAVYKRREERKEGSYRLPQYFADALYELAAKYEVELAQDAVYVNGVEVDATVCYQRRTAEDCARAIERYVRKEWPKVLEQRRRREVMCQMAKAAVAEYGRWHEIPTDELKRAFWWEGKWLGRPISCFVTDRRAYCTTDGKRAVVFYVIDAPDGVYLRPEIKLFDELIKVAHRGDGL